MFDRDGRARDDMKTSTGHLENQWSVGPALLWSPWFAVAHVGVRVARIWHPELPADGYSWPYRYACAVGTAVYGWIALLLAWRAAELVGFTAAAPVAVAMIWPATPLPVYQLFLPFHVHALAAFGVAWFVWRWLSFRPSCACHSGRLGRDRRLMTSSSTQRRHARRGGMSSSSRRRDGVRPASSAVARSPWPASRCAPQLIGKAVVYGTPFTTGYHDQFFFAEPRLLQTAFSRARPVLMDAGSGGRRRGPVGRGSHLPALRASPPPASFSTRWRAIRTGTASPRSATGSSWRWPCSASSGSRPSGRPSARQRSGRDAVAAARWCSGTPVWRAMGLTSFRTAARWISVRWRAISEPFRRRPPDSCESISPPGRRGPADEERGLNDPGSRIEAVDVVRRPRLVRSPSYLHRGIRRQHDVSQRAGIIKGCPDPDDLRAPDDRQKQPANALRRLAPARAFAALMAFFLVMPTPVSLLAELVALAAAVSSLDVCRLRLYANRGGRVAHIKLLAWPPSRRACSAPTFSSRGPSAMRPGGTSRRSSATQGGGVAFCACPDVHVPGRLCCC